MPEAASGFLSALAALAEGGIAYVIVGVGGINFYARTPAEAYATLDLDLLLGTYTFFVYRVPGREIWSIGLPGYGYPVHKKSVPGTRYRVPIYSHLPIFPSSVH